MALKLLDLDVVKVVGFPDDDSLKDAASAKFTLGMLDSIIFGRIQDKLLVYAQSQGDSEAAGSVEISLHETATEAIRFALSGWENVVDPKTNAAIKFETEEVTVSGQSYKVVKLELLRRIPIKVLLKLYRDVQSMNRLTEDEVKNSVGE